MACQSNCQTTIKYLCKEMIDIKKEFIDMKKGFIGLQELYFDIINTTNVQQHREKSETMEDNVEVLNNINVTDYNLMENYSKPTTIVATVEEPLEARNTNSNLDWKPTNKNLGHEDKPENVLFLQKILENQLAMQKEIQDIKTDQKKQEETCAKLQEDTQRFLQSAATLPEIETIKADLMKLEATCGDREEDSQTFRNSVATLNAMENIKADLEKLNETCDRKQEDTEHVRQTAASLEEKIESIGADLGKLWATCDDREEDSQTFRRSVATLNEMENIKADLEKLNKTYDKRQEDTQYFRQTLEEKIESIGADLKKLEETCETRQKNTDTHVKAIDQKVTEISAKTQTASSEGNEKSKKYTGKEDFRKKFGSDTTRLIESVLKVYPERFFLFHPNCLNLDNCKELLSMNSWLHKVKNLDIPRMPRLADYLNVLLHNFDKIMAYYEENFGSFEKYNSNSC